MNRNQRKRSLNVMLHNKPLFALLLALLLFSAGSYTLTRYYRQMISEPLAISDQEPEWQEFMVEPGGSVRLIAEHLEEQGLIRSALWLRVYYQLHRSKYPHVQAGVYRLSPTMNIPSIVEELQTGSFDIKLTVPEGLRAEEIAQLLNESDLAPAECQAQIGSCTEDLTLGDAFLGLARRNQFDYDLLNDLPFDQTLEGFLFPDTYFISPLKASSGTLEEKALEILGKMLDNFDQKFSAEMQTDLKKQGLTIYQAVTLASIVEREVKHQEDRSLVAGILLKRWRNHWPLEADATTQYAVADEECEHARLTCRWWKEKLDQRDLAIDSPYNTRQVVGLPPTPIANPGLAALQAVAYPDESEYWYYLSDQEGKTHYAVTLEQHQENIRQYLH